MSNFVWSITQFSPRKFCLIYSRLGKEKLASAQTYQVGPEPRLSIHYLYLADCYARALEANSPGAGDMRVRAADERRVVDLRPENFYRRDEVGRT